MFECDFCKNSFKTKSSLNSHQRTAKYCLKIQNCDITTNFQCPHCELCLSTKHRLDTHIKICKKAPDSKTEHLEYLEKLIDEQKQLLTKKDKIITKLKTKSDIYKELSDENAKTIKEIAKQPKTQNNQNNQLLLLTPLDLNDKKKVKELIETGFTRDYLLSGQQGVAKFAVDYLLKDDEGNLKYICTDPARSVFKYRSTQGEVRRDVKAKKLTSYIADDVKRKSANLISNEDKLELAEILMKNGIDIHDMEENNTDFRGELASLTISK